MTWMIFGILAGLVWGSGNIVDKFLIDRKLDNPWYFLLVSQLFNALVGISIVLWFPIHLNFTTWLIVICAALLNQVGQLFYVSALRFADVSQVVPLYIGAMFVIPLGDALFLGNIFAPVQYTAMGLLGFGGLALMFDRKHGLTRNWRVIALMLLSVLSFSGFWLIGDVLVEQVNALQYIGVSYALGTVWLPMFVFIYWLLPKPNVRKQRIQNFLPYITFGALVALLLSSQLSTIGKIFFTHGLEDNGTASIVESMTLVQHILVFVGSALLAKRFPAYFSENITPQVLVQKGLSITIMILGALLLVFG